MDKMQQRYIDNHHVIKIPISDDAALFFTKDSAQLKVFAYKWDDAKPGEKNYTGTVISFSYQNYNAAIANFNNGKYFKGGTLAIGKSQFGLPAQSLSSSPITKSTIKTNGIFGAI